MKLLSTINVAHDFSRYPAGRYSNDGTYSGEAFRNNVLIPMLQDAEKVEIELDGTIGYGSSFLEEAFGGLIRNQHFKASELHARLKLTTESLDSIVKEIWSYIDEADK